MRALEWSWSRSSSSAAMPLVAGCYQFALAALHALPPRARRGAPAEPRVAIVVPAWNEAAVIDRTLDRCSRSTTRPTACASTSSTTPAPTTRPTIVLRRRRSEHPGRVFHLRREQGGEGKAHTINHGLRAHPRRGLVRGAAGHRRRRDLHPPLAPADGAPPGRPARRRGDRATSRRAAGPANYMNRFIAFEYVTAQAGARRAQNVLGAQACLAGGAQLLRRESARGARRRDRHLDARGGHRHDVRRAARRPARRLRAARDRPGGGAARHRRAVEAAAALGRAATCRSRSRFRRDVAAARERRPARRDRLRAHLVLGLPDAGPHGPASSVALVALSLLDGGLSLDVVPRALVDQPRSPTCS